MSVLDEALFEGGEGDGELDGGAGLGAGGEGELLVDHGEDAAAGGVDGEGGAVHVAEGFNGGGANDWVFPGGDVSGGLAVSEGGGVEALADDARADG